MAEMLRVTTRWSGFVGSPGFTNLYFRDFAAGPIDQTIADGVAAKVNNWNISVAAVLPVTATITTSPTFEVVESTNGQLQRLMTVATIAPRTGTGAGAYSAASGIVVNWHTAGIRNGRRVRGRSFLVPIGGPSMAADGTIDTAKLAALQAAATQLVDDAGAGDLGVWSRPSAPGAADGEWFAATNAVIPDKVAVLTSRRD